MQGFFLLRTGKIGWSKYYHAARASEQGSLEKSRAYQNLTRTITYYTEGVLFSIIVKEGKKPWACLEKISFLRP